MEERKIKKDLRYLKVLSLSAQPNQTKEQKAEILKMVDILLKEYGPDFGLEFIKAKAKL